VKRLLGEDVTVFDEWCASAALEDRADVASGSEDILGIRVRV